MVKRDRNSLPSLAALFFLVHISFLIWVIHLGPICNLNAPSQRIGIPFEISRNRGKFMIIRPNSVFRPQGWFLFCRVLIPLVFQDNFFGRCMSGRSGPSGRENRSSPKSSTRLPVFFCSALSRERLPAKGQPCPLGFLFHRMNCRSKERFRKLSLYTARAMVPWLNASAKTFSAYESDCSVK